MTSPLGGGRVLFFLLGKQDAVEATLVALGVVAEPLGKMAGVLVEVCAYAGSFFYKKLSFFYFFR